MPNGLNGVHPADRGSVFVVGGAAAAGDPLTDNELSAFRRSSGVRLDGGGREVESGGRGGVPCDSANRRRNIVA